MSWRTYLSDPSKTKTKSYIFKSAILLFIILGNIFLINFDHYISDKTRHKFYFHKSNLGYSNSIIIIIMVKEGHKLLK